MSAAKSGFIPQKAVLISTMLLFLAITTSAGTSYAESARGVVVQKVMAGFVLAGGITFTVSESTKIFDRLDGSISIKMLQPESTVNIIFTRTGKKTARATQIKIVKDPPG